ncbi:MAG: AMP-binding protein [Hyphomicrobiaceae bacterium]
MVDTVPDLAAKRAEISPDKTAFHDVASARRLTFADVNARADRIAHALSRLAGPGERIAILCQNRCEFFDILFACQKAQLILVPLNWRQPAAELAPVVGGVDARVLLFDNAFAATAAALAVRVQGLALVALDTGDADGRALGEIAADAPAGPFGPGRRAAGDAWYLLHTSGTTGQPKAVIQTFGMAIANAVNVGQAIDLVSTDTSVNFLPLFHTAGINLYTLPLFLAGGLSHVLAKFDPGAVLRLTSAGEVTQFFGVPAIYQALSLDAGFAAADFSRTRGFGCGGAPLPEPLIRLYAERGVRVCNGYGMTETGPTVFLNDAANTTRKIGSVGKAQLLAETRLVAPDGAVVGGAGTGELQVRGAVVTPGYFGNADATRAAFTSDGWLRTGDIARRDEDGYFYIVDRIKDMYISGGENVYPAEVETVLLTHPAILEVAVVGVPDPTWGEAGRAYLIPRGGATLDTAALPAWCRERIAAYKIPRSFVVLSDFPRTAAGKIQKHLLKATA